MLTVSVNGCPQKRGREQQKKHAPVERSDDGRQTEFLLGAVFAM
jgi:hypothetical protein